MRVYDPRPTAHGPGDNRICAARTPSRCGRAFSFFPGGVPLYKNGRLVGAIGVSGDGVDQDDIIAFSGSKRFLPPSGIRSEDMRHSVFVP